MIEMKTLTINDTTFDITDDGTVRFDSEQTLTPEQQALARQNIGVGELDDLIGSGLEEVTYTPNLTGFISVETGTLNTTGFNGQVFHTDYLALDGYAKIYAQYCLSSIGYAIAFFDSSKLLITNISIKGAGAQGYHIIDMDIPNEAAYCMLSCYDYSGNPSSNYIKLIPVTGIMQRMNKLEEDMANFVSTSVLNGKTIAVLGDSISSVAYTVPNYWQMIAEKTGCNFLDYGVSGACFAVRSGSTTSFVERASSMGSADAVLVMGGTNDANKNILLGDWASTDNTTLYGALNALIAKLRSKYPGRPIIFCTPIKMKGDKDDGFPKTMADLKNTTASTNLELWHCALAIKAKCAVHGIPVIDLYNESGIGSGLSEFFRTDDTLHPSDIGECRIANMVQPVLEQQFLYTADYPEEVINWVERSQVSTTDTTVFNTWGYMDGYRLSSSGSTSPQEGCTVTGFIPFKYTQTLRIKGVTMKDTDANGTYRYNAYICLYKKDGTLLGCTSNGGNKGICASKIDAYKTGESNGVHTYSFASVSGADVDFIRISSPFGEAGSGSGMFVTVDQEIT